MAEHKPARIVLIVLTVAVFAVLCVFNALAGSGGNDVFRNNTGDVSAAFETEITPAGWTFSIWGFIYFFQALWLLYGLSTICRHGVDGYLYYSPDIMPVELYVFYILNNLLNIGWLIFWDRQSMVAAAVFLFLIWFSLVVCIAASFRALNLYLPVLFKNGKMLEVWLIRFTLHVGLGAYITWVTIATLLNITIAIQYEGGMASDSAAMIALSIFAILLGLWFSLDMTVLDRYTRYFFITYPAATFALSGVLSKQWHPDQASAIYVAVLLAVAGVMTIVKLVVMVYRHCTRPTLSDVILDKLEDRMGADNKGYEEL